MYDERTEFKKKKIRKGFLRKKFVKENLKKL